MWLLHAKTIFYCYDIWLKLNIGKKIAGLEIMTWNHGRSFWNISFFYLKNWYKIMEYDVSRMEFVKTQYVIQMSEHISVFIALFTMIYFLKVIYFIIYSDMCCDMFFLLHCFAFAELKCLVVSPTLMCLLPNTLYYSGFLWIETQLNMKLQMNYL